MQPCESCKLYIYFIFDTSWEESKCRTMATCNALHFRLHIRPCAFSRTAEGWRGVRCSKMARSAAQQGLGAQWQPCPSHTRATPATSWQHLQPWRSYTIYTILFFLFVLPCHALQRCTLSFNRSKWRSLRVSKKWARSPWPDHQGERWSVPMECRRHKVWTCTKPYNVRLYVKMCEVYIEI